VAERRPKVVITSQGATRNLLRPEHPPERRARAAALLAPFELVWETSGDPARLAAALADADFLITENEMPITRELIAAAPRLRLIQIGGRRCVAVDVAAARERGIPVAVCPLRGTLAVAEHTIALMLALAKQLLPGDRAVRRGAIPPGMQPTPVLPGKASYNWLQFSGLGMLDGATLSILGAGDIGLTVAELARALGMRVLYWSRRRLPPAEEERFGMTWVAFDDAFRQGDYVSVHVLFTAATTGLIGARELALMRPTAFLINTARAPIVDEQALIAALRERRIAGAGLDTYWEEPAPPNHPLYALDNVVLTPHYAGGDFEIQMGEVGELFGRLKRVWEGQPPLDVVEG
jgi:D-3-phosphoglycerate dehydrogenase